MDKKISKDELSSADVFISWGDRALDLLGRHAKAIGAAVVSVFVLGAGYAAFEWWSYSREQDAQAQLFEITKDLDKKRAEKLKDEEPKAEVGAIKDAPKKPATAAEVKDPEALRKDYGIYVERYQKLVAEQNGRKAALMAAIDLAALQTEFKDYDGAQKVLADVAQRVSPKSFYFGLIHTQWASALAALNENGKAIEALEKVLNSAEQAYLHPDVILKLGLLYEKSGDPEKAKAMYHKASNEFAQSDAGRSAKSYLRLLLLKAKEGTSPAQQTTSKTQENKG